jgi:hypothetical protein
MRYVLHPGFVVSKTDGDQHYIGIGKLLELYMVPRTAIWVNAKEPGYHLDEPGDIHCRPLYDGDYPLFDR